MENITINEENTTKENFVKYINKCRLQYKNNWIVFSGIVENKEITLKYYNTYLQIYKVNNINYGGLMDINIKQFKEELNKPFKGINND